ncbi:ABC transporter permease [Paucibacter sp. Y2R2-4]|uniref:ABC transporter permease n=1 Tax=Paucibacter sp. Y2R2-4 TaxID=2893553 RepID=UPI0021E4FA6E|nr:ABC transporter permease [Paucibacter sp. Y2R2-4]MCV2348467.1 ABC transporter permease [Paucibacter sp. Y2R2-4]
MKSLSRLAWRYLWAQPLTSSLNLLLLSLGLAAISFVLLVSEQIEAGVQRDLAGIDLVVGAKGSPMQIMLSGVFHLDVPTGNIPLQTLTLLKAQPLVARAIPLSLGDSLQGYRIVGTTPEYLELYRAKLATGQLWQRPLQAVLGAEVARQLGLRPGQQFSGSHGLGEQGDAHAEQPYTVVGVLASTGGVIDRLVLTDLASVWAVHEAHHGSDQHGSDHQAEDAPHEEAGREVTLALLSYRSPLAAISLPRWVNAQPGLQAAAPALESARLLRMMGVGTEVLRGFGLMLLLAAAGSVFVTLLHSVRARQADLAMLRMLGAPPWRVAALVSLEALYLALLASGLGLLLGHGLVGLLGHVLAADRSLQMSGVWFSRWELGIPVLALGLSLLAAAWPARAAFRLDVSDLLQAPR